jgi:lycopene cyclase domain-containing protein
MNIVFMAIVLIALAVRPSRPSKAFIATFVGLIVLTALFDNLIIAADIVGYDSSKISGWYVGIAPIEDFMYALLAAVIVPVIWTKLGKKYAQ